MLSRRSSASSISPYPFGYEAEMIGDPVKARSNGVSVFLLTCLLPSEKDGHFTG